MPETLNGLIDRVTYHNPENGFAVLQVKVKGREDLVSVIGSTTSVTAGEHLEAITEEESLESQSGPGIRDVGAIAEPKLKDKWIPATPDAIPPSGWLMVREVNSGQDFWVDPKSVQRSAPRSELTDEQMDRLRHIVEVLREHDLSSVDDWFDDMRRDQDPETEIRQWEDFVTAFQAEIADRPTAGFAERHLIYSVLLAASTLPDEKCNSGTVMSMFPQAKRLAQLNQVVERFRKKRFDD